MFVGLVLARGSSKTIEDKNIKVFVDKPLIAWVLEPMINSQIFDEIWVSTDDNRIESIVQSYGLKVHRRTATNASDSSSSLSSVLEFLETNSADQICLVQCTSPFLPIKYLKSAHKLMTEGEYDSVFSVYRSHCLRWSHHLNPLNFDPRSRPRRQDWQGEFVESGHFYCFTRSLAVSCGLLQGGKCCSVEVDKQYCIEIDDIEDWNLALHRTKYLNFERN